MVVTADICRISFFWLCLFSGWVFSRFFLSDCNFFFLFWVPVWLGIFQLFGVAASSGNTKMFQTNPASLVSLKHPAVLQRSLGTDNFGVVPEVLPGVFQGLSQFLHGTSDAKLANV